MALRTAGVLALVSVMIAALLVSSPAGAQDGLLCEGRAVTVDIAQGDMPTDGDDVIRGTSGDDTIDGLGGNDTICGLGGDDLLNGNDGFDRIFAGAGNDDVSGGAGNDRLVGGVGSDTVLGGPGNDRIWGGAGDDELHGEGGYDRLIGMSGNDVLRGGSHDDELNGNVGRDQLFGDGGNDVLRGGAWKDVMVGGPGNNDGCTLTDPGGLTETRLSCETGVFGASVVPPLNEVIGPPSFVFDSKSAELTANTQLELQTAVEFFEQNTDVLVTIEGHTSTDGAAADNLALSQLRAEAVKQFLVDNGIEESRLSTIGVGESQPILIDGVEDVLASNRVEFLLR